MHAFMKNYFCPPSLLLNRSLKYALIVTMAAIFHNSCAQNPASKKDEFPPDRIIKTAFWNLENYFDTINGNGFDGEFTPTGTKAWNTEKYLQKTLHLQDVIHAIKPDLLGVCEVENASVLKTLVASDSLKKIPYGIVHFESPDERGIDVALIYNKNKVFVVKSHPIKVLLPGDDKTRDILYVKLVVKTKRDTVHVFVNHWPSRRGGENESEHLRKIAASTLISFIDSMGIGKQKFIVMGDFNDNPEDNNISSVLGAGTLDMPAGNMVNLYEKTPGEFDGTCMYKNHWNRYDQIMLGHRFFLPPDTVALKYHPGSFKRFAPEWMTVKEGANEGAPWRTFVGEEWKNGYSDHFPVLAELRYE
jgi:predicted extracellular nuclease